MNFHNLRSLIGTQKTKISFPNSDPSFRIVDARQAPYIEPGFTKSIFDHERPSVVLISAVGATGKSALAQTLSSLLQLPLLDLSKQKPVGGNSLIGLLTNSFELRDLGKVLESISKGRYGVIIDGIDEGRSKTTEKAFEAFLDDVVRLAKGSEVPCIVMLGRTQVLDQCWMYLESNGVRTGLVSIDPFDAQQAKDYIDQYSKGPESPHAVQYAEVRDEILNRLSNAFRGAKAAVDETFLSFIGYPPVLDAIVILLKTESNYHKIRQALQGDDAVDVEVSLLQRIAEYILRREKEDKVVPNVVTPLLAPAPEILKSQCAGRVYTTEEQCARLLAFSLGEELHVDAIPDPVLNAGYEESLATFFSEHPFLQGKEFRNAVFEAMALATCVSSERAAYVELALRYASSHLPNYHFVYFLNKIAPCKVPQSAIRALLAAAMEFQAPGVAVELTVDIDDSIPKQTDSEEIEIEVEILTRQKPEEEGEEEQEEIAKVFRFGSKLQQEPIRIGPRLSNAFISIPTDVSLHSDQDLEITSPVEINARKVSFDSPTLTLKVSTDKEADTAILIQADRVVSNLTSLEQNGVPFTIAVSDREGIGFPIVGFVRDREDVPDDPLFNEKYLRLRKLLSHFRSHSKGALAKYRDKVENERVAGNRTGKAILSCLVEDAVLELKGPLYFLNQTKLDEKLGVNWTDLRHGRIPQKLVQYLRSISVD